MSRCTNRFPIACLLVAGAALMPHPAAGQVIGAGFVSNYQIIYNGSAGDVSPNYGGLLFKAGDANTLLLLGKANGGAGSLYSIPVVRNATNHITGFGALSTVVSEAAFNDGGLVYAPNGALLYTRYPTNQLGQIKPGSVSTDKVVDLSPLGVGSSVGTLQYVPAGFAGAGTLKLASYNTHDWYDLTLTPDGSGTYNAAVSGSLASVGVGPEGIVYVRNGNPNFGADSLLLSEYGAGAVRAYAVDADGNPVGAPRDFITGLSGAEGGTVDPLTGDFVFSTFGGGNKIVVVSGFTHQVPPPSVPEPSSVLGLLLGSATTGGAFALRRLRGR